MDFITRYYKTLSENLQAQKENLLLEVRRRQTAQVIDPYTGNATQQQALNPARLPGMEWAQPTPQQYFSPIPQQTAAAPTPLNPARLPGMEWAQPTPQQYFSTRSQGRVPPTLLQNPTNQSSPAAMGMIPGPGGMPIPMMNPNAMPAPQTPNLLARDPNVPVPASPSPPQQPQSGSIPQMGMIPGPGGRPIPVVNPTQAPPTLLQDPNQFPQQASQQPNNFVEIDPTIPAVDPLAPPNLLAADPNVPVPTGPVSPALPPTTPGAAPTAASAAAPAAAAFAGRGPLMSKKDQSAYDKMVGDVMRARGMAVPILKTGKGGNYQEWRSAVDARNAAMRDANIAVTLRQNQMRDQQNLARQNRDAAKAAGDDAAVARYQQELNDINRSRGNLNKDTGRYSLGSDTTSQGRIANDQLQASWKKKQDDFKARTGMDYDPSNPQHTRVMQNPNMSPEAMQTALSVGEFNKEWSAQNAENSRKQGELDRSVDAKTAELNKLRTNPDYRKEVRQKDIQAAIDSGQVDRVALDAENEAGVDSRFRGLRQDLEKEAAASGERAVQDDKSNRRAAALDQIRRTNPIFNAANPTPQTRTVSTDNFSLDDQGRLVNQPGTAEYSPIPANMRNAQAQSDAEQTVSGRPNIPSLNMVGNAVARARANAATTPPIQKATVVPPAPGAIPPAGRPTPAAQPIAPMSTGGMNTPADINDPQANARKPRGNVVTAAARTMSPNSSAPRLS